MPMLLKREFAVTASMLCLSFTSMLGSIWPATAQSYPSRPIHIVVGFSAGDPNDLLARILAQWLSERFGQSVLVENRPGAGSNVATEAVVRSPGDGHTLVMVSASAAINATLYNNLKFNFIRDIAPVASIIRLPLFLVVHPSLPVESVSGLVDYAKANPGKLNYASSGNGTGPHMAVELFMMLAGIRMTHVPYRGAAPALADLLSGQVQMMITGAAGEYIRDGKLRALAVTAPSRLEAFGQVPTVGESVPGYESSTWFGVGAPKSTPPDIINRLNAEINAGLADAKVRNQLIVIGGIALPGSPDEFGKLIYDETEKWARVVTFSGAKVE